LKSEEHEKAWLIRTATNLCKDHFRHWWSKTVSIDHATEAAVDQPFDIDSNLEKVLALPSRYKTAIYYTIMKGIRLLK
jgi:DNA-directed RNA polymerase specialized sigma24 family protein